MTTLLVIALATLASPVGDIAQAYALIEKMDFEGAVPVAHGVSENPAASKDQKVEAMFLEAYCLAVTDKQEQASAVFQKLVALDIDAKPKFEMEFKANYLFIQAHDEEVRRRKEAADAEKAKLFATVKMDVKKPE